MRIREDCRVSAMVWSPTVKVGLLSDRTEVTIPIEQASLRQLWKQAGSRRVHKTRYTTPSTVSGTTQVYPSMVCTVDEHHGSLAGLMLAEVEFDERRARDEFVPQEWFGREVTDDRDFRNSVLAQQSAEGSASI